MTDRPNNPVYDRIKAIASDWIGEQVVRLGNYSAVVETGKPGKYYARQHNGQVIQAVNSINIPPTFDLRVLVRRARIQPNVWRIAELLEDYIDPVTGGTIAHHHEQHEETGSDRVTLSRKQIKEISLRVASGFTVRFYGGAIQTASGVVLISNQDLNLSAEVITSGSKLVTVQTDDDGVLSWVAGSVYATPEAALASDIPDPTAGQYGLYFVLFYAGQTALADSDIRPIMPLAGSGIVHSHTYALDDLSDVNAPAPNDGQVLTFDGLEWIPADIESGGGGHIHGTARWNGASGQTVFDLPDLAEYMESLMLNGLEEDPLVYSLSADGAQITLDSALAVDTNVIAHYVVLNL